MVTTKPPTVTSNLPVPDPTELTTQAVDRAKADIDKLLGALREVIETRLTAMDRATELVAQDVARIDARTEREQEKLAADFDRRLTGIRELFDEKINRIADVLAESVKALVEKLADRDERVKQAAAEAATQLNAALAAGQALQAQQNTANATASNKQELQFQRLMDQQNQTNAALFNGQGTQLADLKARIGVLETIGSATAATRQEVRTERGETRLNINMVVGAVGLVLAVVVLVIGLRTGSTG